MRQGGRGKVRFQPRIGQLLAAAAENVVNLFNVETDIKTQSLKVFLHKISHSLIFVLDIY